MSEKRLSATIVPYAVNAAQYITTAGNLIAQHRSDEFIVSTFTDCLFAIFSLAFVQSVRFLYALHKSDPGVVAEDATRNFKHQDMLKTCPYCHKTQPLRAKHSKLVDACVAQFDHDCAFLGNAIGQFNRWSFWKLLLWEILYHALSLILNIVLNPYLPEERSFK